MAGIRKQICGTGKERSSNRPDKRVRFKGKLYGSPSAAASAIRKHPTNGWSFWHYERGPNDWVPIDQLRE